MRNEWRSNIWIITELVVVSGVLWFIFIFFGTVLHTRMQKYGYDTSNICVASIQCVPNDSKSYTPYEGDRDINTDFQMLLANLRDNPNVEYVGFGSNILPYQFNYWGSRVNYADRDTVYTYDVNVRTVSPDVIRALKIEGCNGMTTEQIARVIERGEMVLGPSEYKFDGVPAADVFLGKEVFTNDTARLTKVGALACGIRRSDYEPLWGGVLYQPVSMYYPQVKGYFPSDLIIRVKPGKTAGFLASLKTADKQVGNVYLSGLRSMDKMKEEVHFSVNTSIRNFSVGAVFLFVIVFLGFLGTFWFRVQQRVGEIAIRKVNGATAPQIFRRLLGEGMILLGIATVIAVPLELILSHYNIIPLAEVFQTEVGNIRFESMAVTFVTLAVMITGGVWFPARAAMKINPALALKDL